MVCHSFPGTRILGLGGSGNTSSLLVHLSKIPVAYWYFSQRHSLCLRPTLLTEYFPGPLWIIVDHL